MGSLLDSMSDHDSTLNSVVVPPVSARGVLDSDDASYLQQLYQRLKPQSGPVAIKSIYVRYSSVTIKGPKFASGKSKSRSNSGSPSFVAMAEWDDSVFGAQPTPYSDMLHPSARYRPVRITHYIRVTFCIGDESEAHLLVAVAAWFLPHPSRNAIGKPAQVWQSDQFECGGNISLCQ